MKSCALVLATLLVTSFPAYALDAGSVPAIKRSKLQQYFSAKEAAEFVIKTPPRACSSMCEPRPRLHL